MQHGTRQLLHSFKPVLLPLAALTGVLALWLGWSSIAQIRDGSRRSELESSRNMGVQQIQQGLVQQFKRLNTSLESPELQTALQTSGLDLGAKVLSAGWPNLEQAEILSPDLDTAYSALPKGGFGRLLVIETALRENKPTSWVVRGGDGPRLALAAPVRQNGTLVGVAYVQLPLNEATAGLQTIGLIDDSYLALRQGNQTLWERGDNQYADAAERMAVPIADSGLRLVAATVAPPAPLFGLDAVPALIAALVCVGVVFVLWRLSRLRLDAVVAVDDAPTLEQAAASAPNDAPVPRLDIKEPAKPAPVVVDRSIFRAYDIRGVVGRTLDPNVAIQIGHAIGSLMHEQGLHDIVVGRDGRLSGPALIEGLVEGLRRAGRNVIDIGMAPTPMIYFGAFHLRTGCCVSVTGSHNPPDYNGFKIVVGGETLSGDAIVDLHTRIGDGRLHRAGNPGSISERDISQDYVMRIASDVQHGRRLKVVVDAGNGVAGEVGPRVLEAIGAEVEELYCEIDGNFPNHHPDPSEPHNLTDLISMVRRRGADLGIAFDGDGDRLGVVIPDGENIYPDRLLMLFAGDVLERNPGAVIVYDVKCTGRLPGYILRHGGSPLMWKTGHSLIKAKMREIGAELAGEMSGHFFFAERWYGFDDGIYAAARLLEILAFAEGSPQEILGMLPKGVSTPEIKVDAPGGDPHAFVERFCDGAFFEGGRMSTIDGMRVDWPDGWGLVRASNTTPVLVMRFDADNELALARIQSAFRMRLHQLQPNLQLPF
ncbi:MAG: phosphomannomutase/phosphoglucomutase [Lysobacteraceae bacterium]|nr:MAG: phosphomannomutase/phosphoglucomutase [Xanthomonadaceae bacterium]